MILRANTARAVEQRFADFWNTRDRQATSTIWPKSNSSSDYFFGFSALPTCFRTNAFTRLNSFWNPLVKSCVPYSNRTTKQKVKKTKRATQKIPRSKDMAASLTEAEF